MKERANCIFILKEVNKLPFQSGIYIFHHFAKINFFFDSFFFLSHFIILLFEWDTQITLKKYISKTHSLSVIKRSYGTFHKSRKYFKHQCPGKSPTWVITFHPASKKSFPQAIISFGDIVPHFSDWKWLLHDLSYHIARRKLLHFSANNCFLWTHCHSELHTVSLCLVCSMQVIRSQYAHRWKPSMHTDEAPSMLSTVDFYSKYIEYCLIVQKTNDKCSHLSFAVNMHLVAATVGSRKEVNRVDGLHY